MLAFKYDDTWTMKENRLLDIIIKRKSVWIRHINGGKEILTSVFKRNIEGESRDLGRD